MLKMGWRIFIVAASIAIFIAGGQIWLGTGRAYAEPPEPPAVANPAPAGEEPAEEQTDIRQDKEVADFTAALEAWRTQIKQLEETVGGKRMPDEELRQVPSLLESLRREIVDRKNLLRPKLDEAHDRLDKLGPAPDQSAPKESVEMARQRERLGAEVAAIDGLMKRADVLIVRANQLIDAANAERRERFAESLLQPVAGYYAYVLPAGLERVPSQLESMLVAAGQWLVLAYRKGPLLLLLLVVAPIGGFLATKRLLGRILSRRAAKRAPSEPAELTLQQRGTAAVLNAVRDCAPLWGTLAAFCLIAAAAELPGSSGDGVLVRASLAVVWASLLIAVVGYSLAPGDASRRLIAVEDDAAWRLARMLQSLAGVWLLDQLWGLSESVVFTPYQITVLRASVLTLLYSGLLIALLLPIRRAGFIPSTSGKWPGWLFWSVALVAGFLLLAMLLGYPGLSRFVGSHFVATAGVLWLIYLLHLVVELVSSVSVISGKQIDDEAPVEEEGAPSLLTIRIIGGLLMDIVIVLVGITILLLLWRFDWVEVRSWIEAAFFGVQLGDLRISLQSVLMALGVFAIGLLLTRFVQRWFISRAFAGRHRDSGLQESTRIGIGYLGFVLAALAGLSYLGLDFSNLAIVAGALSVGIGFGLQSIFNNFASGIILLVERPIKIGDWIAVGDHEGMVKRISVRSTEIETIYRQSVIIPNANLITNPVTNWMHGDKSCRLDVPIGVAYGTDVRLLRTVLLDVGASHGAVLKYPAPVVHFAGFGDSSLDFELRVFLRDARQRITVASDLRFAILPALNNASISIPFPQRDIHLKGDDSPDKDEAEEKAGGSRQTAKISEQA
jgi:potassium-dependent mechanosensitive channel